jgi:hypothetical protein
MGEQLPVIGWSTQVTAIDVTTGEIISKKLAESGKYFILRKTIKTTINEKTRWGTRHIQWECKPNNQLGIFE